MKSKVKYDVYEIPKEDGKTVYHARLVPTGTVTTESLAETIEFGTSLTKGDVLAVIVTLSELITRSLKEGKRVHIQGLGYFQMAIKSKEVEDPKKMRGDAVEFKSVAFRSERNLKLDLRKTKFERVSKKNHSVKQTNDEIKEKLSEYFLENVFITRSGFQEKFGLTRNTAQRKINELVKDGTLKKDGNWNFPVYLPVDNK